MPTRSRLLPLVVVGLIAGFLSGLFGVGGGVLIVPALVLMLGFDQKVASGTSLIAVAPIALVGTIVYGVQGQVAWAPAIILAATMIVGGSIGSWLLAKLPTLVVTWIFLAALVVVAVQLMFQTPDRSVVNVVDGWGDVVVIAVVGVAAGMLSGLIGVGGGIIIVPVFIVFIGLSDVVSKGVSLVGLLPNALTTSIQNLRRRNGRLAEGLTVGIAGAATTLPGNLLANALDSRLASILFAVFLLAVGAQLAVRTTRKQLAARRAGLDPAVAEEPEPESPDEQGPEPTSGR